MLLMKASEARAIVEALEKQERLQRELQEQRDRALEDERITEAPEWAERYFHAHIVETIKKAVQEKRRNASIQIEDPTTRSGHARTLALVKVITDNGYSAMPPKFNEIKGHDPDFGHFDMSHWEMIVTW